jgi:hypothetical protein
MDLLRRLFRNRTGDETRPDGSPGPRHVAAARAALERAQPREALRQINLGIEADPAYAPLYTLVTTIYAFLPAGQQLFRLYSAVAERPDDPWAYYDLGSYLTGGPSHRTALPLLRRALSLVPAGDAAGQVKVSCALATALLGEFRPAEARDVLRAAGVGGDSGAAGDVGSGGGAGEAVIGSDAGNRSDTRAHFLLHHARLLCGETGGVRRFVEQERPRLAGQLQSIPEGPERQEAQELLDDLEQLGESLRRLETVGEPGHSLARWHYVQYGAALLHTTEVTVAAVAGSEGPQSAGGRYVGVVLSNEDVERIAARLARLLTAIGRVPDVVVALPDRDSVRAAEVVARALGVACEAIPDRLGNLSSAQQREAIARERELLERQRCLFVAGDNRTLDAYPQLRRVEREQLVFAFNHHWLAAAALTPDVGGLMSQICRFPWQQPPKEPEPAAPEPGRRRGPADPQPRLAENVGPPMEAAEVPAAPAAFDEALGFYKQHAGMLKGAPDAGPMRWRFRRDSPVVGDYFA